MLDKTLEELTSVERRALMRESWAGGDTALLNALEREFLIGLASRYDPDGFAAFYKLTHGNDLPPHARAWINHIFGCEEKGEGVLIFSWRGSWKTVTISVTLVTFYIGHHPTAANLIVQANEASANDTTEIIANIVQYSSSWKEVFPNVVPDELRGWGAKGYHVKRKDLEYDAWNDLITTRRDPTLLGLGIRSKALIGRHPTGILLLDDIHDEENSASERERANTINKLTGTILPFLVEDDAHNTLFIGVGTPWHTEDAYHYLQGTGEFGFHETPVMSQAKKEDKDAFRITAKDMTHGEHTDIYGWWTSSFLKNWKKETIIRWRNRTGKREFWRMYMLNLAMATDAGIKYVVFPSENIDVRWPMGAGVDYASTIQIRGKKLGTENRSKFAMCYGAKTPFGKAVIYDGIVGHYSQWQCENYVERAQGMFENYDTTGVEMDGKGEELYALLSRKPNLQLLPFWTGGASKLNRQERILAPYLETGLLMVSDGDTDYLNALRKSLDEWPHGNSDVIDALYAYAKTIPEVLQILDSESIMDDEGVFQDEYALDPGPFAKIGRR